MKEIVRVVLIVSCAVLLSCPAFAQQAVAPLPQPAGSAPSLAETMQFLQTKLNEQGKMSWTTHYHDSADATNWTYAFIFETSKVVADAAACKVGYHYKITRDGTVTVDDDASFSLRDVQDLTLTTGDLRQNKNDTAAGHTTWDAKVDPPVFDLIVRGQEKAEFYFFFFNEDTANRVTKAMGHAVELCGGSRGSF
jgi:hypothetical protein